MADLRVVGVDLGTKRIGVALSNSEGTLALPYEVVARSGDRARDHRRLAALVAEAEASRVIVGLPLSLAGRVEVAAQTVLDEVAELSAVLPVPVETYDERFTTVTAHHSLREAHLDSKARRKVVDQVAASVLLQAWLDGARRQADSSGA